MAGLFDTFTISKRGLAVQQSNINTCSHNIANVKTEGYSRQRSVVETTRPFGGNSRFDSCGPGQVGTGAEVTTIMRIRDSFIDYQLRNEYGKLGNAEVKSNFLSQVQEVFAEPSDSSLQNLFSNFYAQFNELAKNSQTSEQRTVALEAADSLAQGLNDTYSSLEKQMKQAQNLLQQNVADINSYLNQINEYNQEINGIAAIGMSPNDLMDKRDLLLDKLSEEFGIVVEKQKRETINLNVDGFNTGTNLVNSDPSNTKYTRFSYVKEVKIADDGNSMTVEYYPLGDSTAQTKSFTVTSTETDADKKKKQFEDMKKNLEQNRILVAKEDGTVVSNEDNQTGSSDSFTIDQLNKKLFKIYEKTPYNTVDNKLIKGSVAGNQSVQDMIQGYMDELDKVAKALAYSVNAIQTGNDGVNTRTNYEMPDAAQYLFFVNSDSTETDSLKKDNNISAKTITVNKELINDVFKLNCAKDKNAGEKSYDRAQAISDLSSVKINIAAMSSVNSREDFFKTSTGTEVTFDGLNVKGNTSGKTIDGYYKDMITILGTKTSEASSTVKKLSENTIASLEDQKAAVSGVSLDEEMTDIIQFHHAYQANAKMISTIDQLLDVVINGLKS